MRYYLPQFRPGMDADHFGLIVSPKMPVAVDRLADYAWCGDNGQFGNWNRETGGLRRAFDLSGWLRWLDRVAVYRETCAFVVAPDHPGNHLNTCRMYDRFFYAIVERGLPVAFAAQDDAEQFIPGFRIDVLFIAGSTAWKMGPGAARLIRRARMLGFPVHVGRVNSARRFRHFEWLGADSCDGTYICYAPDEHYHRLLAWARQTALFNVP
jgi:hypothetical protein